MRAPCPRRSTVALRGSRRGGSRGSASPRGTTQSRPAGGARCLRACAGRLTPRSGSRPPRSPSEALRDTTLREPRGAGSAGQAAGAKGSATLRSSHSLARPPFRASGAQVTHQTDVRADDVHCGGTGRPGSELGAARPATVTWHQSDRKSNEPACLHSVFCFGSASGEAPTAATHDATASSTRSMAPVGAGVGSWRLQWRQSAAIALRHRTPASTQRLTAPPPSPLGASLPECRTRAPPSRGTCSITPPRLVSQACHAAPRPARPRTCPETPCATFWGWSRRSCHRFVPAVRLCGGAVQ